MAWIDKYLSKEDIAAIEKAIEQAEHGTNGEIVPVIVGRSSVAGHIPLSLTLLFTLTIVIAEIPYSQWLWVTPWIWLWPVLLVALYLISCALAKLPWVQKVFVPERDEVFQVHQRAQLEFYTNRIHRTQGNTGILLFVSVMEKKAVILADEGIAKKLPPGTWDDMLAELRSHLHKGRWGPGFQKAIQDCGQLLKTHFPINGEVENELKNHLIIKD